MALINIAIGHVDKFGLSHITYSKSMPSAGPGLLAKACDHASGGFFRIIPDVDLLVGIDDGTTLSADNGTRIEADKVFVIGARQGEYLRYAPAGAAATSGYVDGEAQARAELGLPTRDLLQACMCTGTDMDLNAGNKLTDFSDYGNHQGDLNGSPCMLFDGTGDWITFSVSPVVTGVTNTFTFACWLYRNGGSGFRMIFSSAETLEFRLTASHQLEFVVPHAGDDTVTVTGTTAISNTTWTHVACTWGPDSDTTKSLAKVYINGVLDGTSTTQADGEKFRVLDWASSWRIGSRTDNSFPITGRICGASIWRDTLAASDLLLEKAYVPCVYTKYGNWPMSEGSGSIVYDTNGATSANNGTIVNAAWSTQDHFHYGFRYGASTYAVTASPGTFVQVPNREARTEITHSAPSGTIKVGSFTAGNRMFPGLQTTIDFTDGTVGGWTTGLSLETVYTAMKTRATPLWIHNDTSELITSTFSAGTTLVVAYGTSLTAGTGGAWFSDLMAWLGYMNGSDTLTTANTAISGSFTDHASYPSLSLLRNLPLKVLNYHSADRATNPLDALFLECSMNDAHTDYGISTTTHRSNVERILEAVWGAHPLCRIFFWTTNPVWDAGNSSDGKRPNLADYYAVDRLIAASYANSPLTFVDTEPLWEAELAEDEQYYEENMSDGVHPDETGSDAIIVPAFKAAVLGNGYGNKAITLAAS